MNTLRLAAKKWAQENKLIIKLYFFGSRVKGTNSENSDLDIAIEIEKEDNDENNSATFIFNKSKWEKELTNLLGLKVDLCQFEGKNIKKYVEEAHELVYEKSKN